MTSSSKQLMNIMKTEMESLKKKNKCTKRINGTEQGLKIYHR